MLVVCESLLAAAGALLGHEHGQRGGVFRSFVLLALLVRLVMRDDEVVVPSLGCETAPGRPCPWSARKWGQSLP